MPEISEDWILEQIEAEEANVDELLAAIDSAAEECGRDAITWAQLAEEGFADRGRERDVLAAMQLRAKLSGDGHGKSSEYAKQAGELLKHNRNRRRMVEDAGFEERLAPAECLRRLVLLLDLKNGCICYDSTWGQGVVKDIDMFYHRVEIDFERKRNHQLSLAYAAETLDLLDREHLLTRLHCEPEQIKSMVADDPAGLVKLAIVSLGQLSVDELKDELIPRVMPEGDWKRFWTSARKALKKDPLFDLPRKRKEPMRILADESELHGRIWFDELRQNRSMDDIVQQLELCIGSLEEAPADPEILDIVANRIDFVITGSLGKQSDLAARALLLAEQFSLPPEIFETGPIYEQFLDSRTLQLATDALSPKYLKAFIGNLIEHDEQCAGDAIVEDLPAFGFSVLNEVLDILIAKGYEERMADKFRAGIARREINARMLLWVLRNDNRRRDWRLGSASDLVPIVFRILENEQTNDEAADYKRLRAECEKQEWIEKAMADMNQQQRKEFTTRVMQSGAWTSLDRKSMLARIIRIDPEMQTVVAPAADKDKVKSTNAKTTSIRSYKQRMQQLENITSREIPENSREIAEARSHGDLRENAEFKAAKERQGLLMKRQGELQAQLQVIEPTDFSDIPADSAGPGTTVGLEYPDGETRNYTILGEWDRDEELNIISSNSQLAKVLSGHRTGNRVAIPSEDGGLEVTILSVDEPGRAAREWIRADI